MTEINFYVSKQKGWDHRLAILYKLVIMARQREMSIHIHTSDSKESKLVDDFLWKHKKSSFIPHSIMSDEKLHISREISIGHDFEPMDHCDYLINLSLEYPSYFSRYLKCAEIIDRSDEILAAGRKRYAFYRDRGYTMEYHQL